MTVMNSVGADNHLVERLREMNSTLNYCSDEVRHDLQRNLIQVVEELMRTNPNRMEYFKAVRDIAETTIQGYKGRGQVHVALRRISDQKDNNLSDEPNVFSLNNLRKTFARHSEADKFLVDRMLAKRNEAGELKLSSWGTFVLNYMDKQERKTINAIQPLAEIKPQ